ncbi:MAG: hypothetical protein KME42_22660 [Tildeniella nuda ZEHNDER 1965/U140]|jgi:hypothetical protein|nr:hypothetical protein [Tildeniella nuda ZEHNDER 1965/U140]
MHNAKKQFVGSMAIASLLCAEALLANTFAHAATPVRVSQGLRSDPTNWSRSYDCGQAQVTVTEQSGDGNRYVYEAVNQRGNTINIKHGTYHRGAKRASVYTFHKNGSNFVVEDLGRGKATLTTSGGGNSPAVYDCKY